MDFKADMIVGLLFAGAIAVALAVTIVKVVTPCTCDTVEVRIGEGGYRWLVCKKCGRRC